MNGFPGSHDSDLYEESSALDAATENRAVVNDGVPDSQAHSGTVSQSSSVREPAAGAALAPATAASMPQSSPAPAAPSSVVATDGFRGVVNRLARTKLRATGAEVARRAAAEQAAADELAVRSSSWTRCMRVLVANRRGGVGKTVTSVLVAAALASLRGSGVAVAEFSDEAGGLAGRCEQPPVRGVDTLLARLVSAGGADGAFVYGNGQVQSSMATMYPTVDPDREPFTGPDVHSVVEALAPLFSTVIMDTGNGYRSAAFTAALGVTDVVIAPTLAGPDAVAGIRDLMNRLAGLGEHGRLLASRVIVVVVDDGRSVLSHREVLDELAVLGIDRSRVYAIPFDAHIASRGPVVFSQTTAASKRAWLAAGAAVAALLGAIDFDEALLEPAAVTASISPATRFEEPAPAPDPGPDRATNVFPHSVFQRKAN